MLEVGLFLVTTLVAPMAIEISRQRGHFRWMEAWLKELWMIIFAFLTMYVLWTNETAREAMMKSHKLGDGPIGYVVVAIFGAVVFCGYWWFLGRVESVSAAELGESQKLPSQQQSNSGGNNTQQSSSGANSPNISGNNNTVSYTDPDLKARLKRIENLLVTQQGDKASQPNLLKKYPLGYTIFDVDYSNSVYPYKSTDVLKNWHLDFSDVKNVDGDKLWLRFPSLNVDGNNFFGITVDGPKKVGPMPGIAADVYGTAMLGEVLAIGEKGIVFVVGFKPTKDVLEERKPVAPTQPVHQR